MSSTGGELAAQTHSWNSGDTWESC